ncbi:MAG: Glycosyl transferase group 2 family protein [Candidatus Moranbacteria bacterium GW2011_GWE2_47_10]|nr:MAG: Glycosyl transferase group 2 family protein [Candidatus Moranbacteria bacterium GW2011_GWE2_47_10]
MPDVSIQIVNYKTKKYLLKCIEDVLRDLRHSDLDYVINVLDNDSGDDLSDLKKIFGSDDKINIYYSDKNLGFGGGHNFLSKKNKSEYLLLMNPDVEIIEKESIRRLMNEGKKVNVAVMGPKLIDRNGNVQIWDHGELFGFRAWIANNAGSSFWRNRNDMGEVAWVSGAVFLIKSDVFEKAGGFDENFFLYKEEEDLCISIRKLGEKIFYNPEIRFMHISSVVARNVQF